MSSSKTYLSRDVEADIWYWQARADESIPTEAEAIRIMTSPTEVDAQSVKIHDIQNNEDNFTPAKNGL
jgi:hypothetical protein